jgi:hypothetical protein
MRIPQTPQDKDLTLMRKSLASRASLFATLMALLSACAGPQVTTTVPFADAVDAPYKNVLVIFLAESFDSRRYLEMEIVKKLSTAGVQAVRSTTLMDSKTPATRKTFLEMVDDTGADAVLVTQIADLTSKGKVVDMNPESTYNFRPTYYYNVWSVELTEYKEPPAVDFEHDLALATQLYSVQSKDVVWAIESKSHIVQNFDDGRDYRIYVDEAKAIVDSLVGAGLVAK